MFYYTYTVQAPVINTSCTANIIMYNITVMDQRSSGSVTVPANVSSVEISEFPNNDTPMVANSEYTITVSAISDQETSYPSDPVVVSEFHMHTYMYTSIHIPYIAFCCSEKLVLFSQLNH